MPGEPEMKMAGGNLSGIKHLFKLAVQNRPMPYLYTTAIITVKTLVDRLQSLIYSDLGILKMEFVV